MDDLDTRLSRLRHHHERGEVWEYLYYLNFQMEALMSSQQADVDALTASVEQVASDLSTAKTNLQAELDSVEAQVKAGGTVNLDALKAAVAPIDSAVQALGALTPSGGAAAPPAA